MIPLNVTHQALFTTDLHARLRSGSPDHAIQPNTAYIQDRGICSTPLRHMLSSLLSFFADAYHSTFGFESPPLHDALTIAYISKPELFRTKRYRVDVDCHSVLSAGQTVVDVWGYKQCDDSWGPLGKNVLVAEDVDVSVRGAAIACITYL